MLKLTTHFLKLDAYTSSPIIKSPLYRLSFVFPRVGTFFTGEINTENAIKLVNKQRINLYMLLKTLTDFVWGLGSHGGADKSAFPSY